VLRSFKSISKTTSNAQLQLQLRTPEIPTLKGAITRSRLTLTLNASLKHHEKFRLISADVLGSKTAILKHCLDLRDMLAANSDIGAWDEDVGVVGWLTTDRFIFDHVTTRLEASAWGPRGMFSKGEGWRARLSADEEAGVVSLSLRLGVGFEDRMVDEDGEE
jgi:hypothetical protein